MGQLAIVVAVDAANALAAETLTGNIWLLDGNRYRGSTGEGTERLETAVEGAQIMNWLVASIDGVTTVTLENVSGEAVERDIVVAHKYESPELGEGKGYWWGGMADATRPGRYAYNLELDLGGTKMTFTSYLHVKAGFTNVTASKRLEYMIFRSSLMR
jgi:hypothetical protein